MGDDAEEAVAGVQFLLQHQRPLAVFPVADEQPDSPSEKQQVQEDERPAQQHRRPDADHAFRDRGIIPALEDIRALRLEDVPAGHLVFRQTGEVPVRPFSGVNPVAVMHQGCYEEVAAGIGREQAVGMEDCRAIRTAEGQTAVGQLAGDVLAVYV